MARQIQIRRGTTDQHENFTGAIGEVTMDTDAKTLRVHDGETVGGIPLARTDQINPAPTLPPDMDYVIESGGDETTWYRRYKSGWVEQGGIRTGIANSSGVTITLPKTMRNANYTVTFGIRLNPVNSTVLGAKINNKATTYFSVLTTYASANSSEYAAIEFYWLIMGFTV